MLFERQAFLVAGLSRSGASAAEYLLSRGAKTYLFDDVEEGSVRETEERLSRLGGIPVSKGELHDIASRCDVLVLSPGIPVDHALPVAFKRAGKRVIGEAELGALALECPVVAVTGTNGKTTTVTLIDEMLRASGKKSIACGNIGKPVTSCLEELGRDGIAVAEISSFQLETLYSLRPHVAVVLNVTEDHLNRHYNMENYVYLKSRILKNSAESEFAVLNFDDPTVRGFAEKTKAHIVWFSTKERVEGGYLSEGAFCYFGEKICPISDFSEAGEHNLSDVLAAICAAKLMGADTAHITAAIKAFQGVAHRIRKVGEIDGISFIDDSKATNVDATVKAIGSMKGETVLLLGGKDKGYSYEPLFEEIKTSSVIHTVIYGENAFRILGAAIKRGYTNVTLCRPFDLAVRVAFLTARAGQNVLLSPASASFDSFQNYEQRGDRFIAVMETLRCEEAKKAEPALEEESEIHAAEE